MIRLRSVKMHRTHLRLRMPFRYGIATLTELPHVILAFTFEWERATRKWEMPWSVFLCNPT
jgi:hypothetical protein